MSRWPCSKPRTSTQRLSTHATCGATSQPCQATCDAVSSVCPAHVLTDLGVTCSTDATTCVSGQDVVVGAVTEAYEGTACAGLVTDIAVPPGPSVELQSAPLQPPSVVQALVEARVQALQAQIPTWASATCQRAARAAVCARHVALPINGLPAISGPWRRPRLPSHRRRRRDSRVHRRRRRRRERATPSRLDGAAFASTSSRRESDGRRRRRHSETQAARPATTTASSARACCPGPTPT